MLTIDFETRSKVDLTKQGAYLYADDPSTEILCMAWHISDESRDEHGVWNAYEHEPFPAEVAEYIENTVGLVAAWNANFDRLIHQYVNNYIGPAIAFNRWYCLSTVSRVNALPGGLEDAHRAVFGKRGKDPRGRQLIQTLCVPQADGHFLDSPMLVKELCEYCMQDVVASVEVAKQLRMLTPEEHRQYLVSERVNDVGVRVDLELASAAKNYAAIEKQELSIALSQITDGAITSPSQSIRIRNWVLRNGGDVLAPFMQVAKKAATDQAKFSLDRRVRASILDAQDSLSDSVAPEVFEVLRLMDEGSNSSVSKFTRMLERAHPETERVYGAFLFAGAEQTKRFASRGLQVHNFRRDVLGNLAFREARQRVVARKPLKASCFTELNQTPVMDTLSKMLRPTLIPDEGRVFLVGDWSSIEARVLPWLTLDDRAEDRLNVFRANGDIYQTTADTLMLPDRQCGKVCELAFGFGGAAGAYEVMARNYRVPAGPEVIGYVDAWRRANPAIVDFWHSSMRAAVRAMRTPGAAFEAGRVEYTFYPGLLGGTLVCKLPGECYIQYPQAKLGHDKFGNAEITCLKASVKPSWQDKTWPRVRLWHGLLVQNATQAMAAELLRRAMTELHMRNWDIPIHVHDEIVIEAPKSLAMEAADDMVEVMTDNSNFEGLPLSVEISQVARYGK